MKPNNTMYHRTFRALLRVIDEDVLRDPKVLAAESPEMAGGALMALNFDRLIHADEHGRTVIAISHYFKQAGDMMADPDMELRIDWDMRTVEALTFKQDGGRPIRQEVYPQPGFHVPRLKRELNDFLRTWLTNLQRQGHHIGWYQVTDTRAESAA